MGRNELVFAIALVAASMVLLTSGQPFWLGLATAVGAFTALWIVSLVLRNASIVDIFWGPGLILVAWVYHMVVPEQPTHRGLLACLLVTVWGLRLALHIGTRNAGHGEDFRYRQWREQAGAAFWWVSYLKVFLLQAVVLWVVATPLALAQLGRPGLTLLDMLGVALWVIGFGFEAVADWQLMAFKRDPGNRGRVLQTGLWRLSRHPNYFGEAVLWWGIGLVGVAGGGPLALISPLLLTFLLLKISGVAMLDRALVERRPGYAEYVASTPAFVPLPRWARRSG
jgi:steroid 5-alpha reductase family enzyme